MKEIVKNRIRNKHFHLRSAVCILTALMLFVSSFTAVLADAVRVPVFTAVPEDVTLISGTSAAISTEALVYGADGTDIKYSLEILKGTRFYGNGEFFTEKSGEEVILAVQTGKGSLLLPAHGIHTARVRAASLDVNGAEIAVGYSPAFEIKILKPVFRSVSAPEICYGEAFTVSAEINGAWTGSNIISFRWEVDDGEGFRAVSEGETLGGVTFTHTDKSVLRGTGRPDSVFTLDFRAVAYIDGASKPVSSEIVTTEFRKDKIVGFSLSDLGMRYFLKSGFCASNWVKHDGKYYYFDPETKLMETGSRIIDGEICTFSPDGQLLFGAVKTPMGIRYYRNGLALSGVYEKDGVKYYFDPVTGYLAATFENGNIAPKGRFSGCSLTAESFSK